MSEDKTSMQLNISSNTNETEIIQRGGIKSVNFVANIGMYCIPTLNCLTSNFYYFEPFIFASKHFNTDN